MSTRSYFGSILVQYWLPLIGVRSLRQFTLLIIALAVVAGLVAGCNSDLGVEETDFVCASDDECQTGESCLASRCANLEERDELCDVYCEDYRTTCTTTVVGVDLGFATTEACQKHCKWYPLTGELGDQSGNSLYCRLYHLDAAKSQSASTHCPHASWRGETFCGDVESRACLRYCFEIMDKCTGENRQFDGQLECLEACADYDDPQLGESGSNTLECRREAMDNVEDEVELDLYCPKAGPNSDECKG